MPAPLPREREHRPLCHSPHSSLKLAPYAASYRPSADLQRHAGPVSLLLELGVEHEVEESMDVEYVDPADVLAAVRSLRDDEGGSAEMQLDLPWELEGGGVISGRAIIVVGECTIVVLVVAKTEAELTSCRHEHPYLAPRPHPRSRQPRRFPRLASSPPHSPHRRSRTRRSQVEFSLDRLHLGSFRWLAARFWLRAGESQHIDSRTSRDKLAPRRRRAPKWHARYRVRAAQDRDPARYGRPRLANWREQRHVCARCRTLPPTGAA